MHPASCAWRIPIGARVWTADGHLLGSVIAAITHVVVVERGWLARQRFVLRPDDITHISDDAVHLGRTLADVEAAARIL